RGINHMKITAFIPARMNSVRLPGKALKEINGLPMVVRVCQAAKDSGVFDAIFVATDSTEIAETCLHHGFDAIMTDSSHKNPTSRVTEAADHCRSELCAMIGGDEPLLTGEIIRSFIRQALPLITTETEGQFDRSEGQRPFAVNAMASLRTESEAVSASVIKVVCDQNGRGLYLSRSPIPFQNGISPAKPKKFVSIGLYTAEALHFFCQTSPEALEQAEHIDLLRFLEYGKSVHFLDIPGQTCSVDTQEDLETVRHLAAFASSRLPKSRRYRGILFDLDGTLLNTAEGVFSSVRHTVEALHYPPLEEKVLRTFIGPPVKQSLIRAYGLNEQEADRATNLFRDRYKNHDLLKAEPYPGILDLLSWLRKEGFLIGVSTLKREDYALTILEHFQIAPLCDVICGSDFASKMTKADVIRKCLQTLNLSPDEAVLIGDTGSDGTGALETGVDLIGVTYGFGPTESSGWQKFSPILVAETAGQIRDFLMENGQNKTGKEDRIHEGN
ncbi:MAG: 3-deoxy-manno-octulosonate cytidylyltransferase, partial [Clostridium sp.]